MVGERSLEVIIKVVGSEGDFFDLQAEVFNKSEDITVSFTLPWDLTFDYHNIVRFIFPHKMGVAFNKNFFLSKKIRFSSLNSTSLNFSSATFNAR